MQKGPERMVLDHTFTKEIALTAQKSGQGIVDVDLDTVCHCSIALECNF